MRHFTALILRAAHSKVPSKLAAAILVNTLLCCAFDIYKMHQMSEQVVACHSAMHRICTAELAYAGAHGHFLTGDSSALTGLNAIGAFEDLPACPDGGRYQAKVRSGGVITVRCSLPEHGEVSRRLDP